MARCLLVESKLPKSMWVYAVLTSVHIRNRCYNHRTDKTPCESCTGQKPDLSKLHVFGTVCYRYVQQTKKLGSQTVKRIRCVSFTDRFNVDQPAQSSLRDDIEQPNVHCDWGRPNDPDRETGNAVNNDNATSDDEQRGQRQNQDA